MHVRRYMKGKGPKPRRLPTSFWGWILPVYSASEDEVIRVAGVDAAMYLRLLSFGACQGAFHSSCEQAKGFSSLIWRAAGCELFLGVAVWCALTVLPTNAGGVSGIGPSIHPVLLPAMRWSLRSTLDVSRLSQGKAIVHLEGQSIVAPSPYTCAAPRRLHVELAAG